MLTEPTRQRLKRLFQARSIENPIIWKVHIKNRVQAIEPRIPYDNWGKGAVTLETEQQTVNWIMDGRSYLRWSWRPESATVLKPKCMPTHWVLQERRPHTRTETVEQKLVETVVEEAQEYTYASDKATLGCMMKQDQNLTRWKKELNPQT